jgi:peptidoglycan/LPS O-acetylase OafA/YrhL
VFGYPLLDFSMAGLVAAAASPRGVLAGLRIPGAASVAAIAYSLYLVHKPVMHVTNLYFGHALAAHPLGAVAAYAGLPIAVGALLYLSVERPFLQLRDRLLSRRGPEPAPAPAQALG